MTEGSVLEESWLGWGSSGWESRMEAGFYLIWGGLGEVGVPLLLSRLSPPCASGATGQHGGDMPSPLHPPPLGCVGTSVQSCVEPPGTHHSLGSVDC